jgi:hypothetical protein
MNYTKPEVAVLGNAVSLIEMTGHKPSLIAGDNGFTKVNPAYDLDE